MGAVFRAEQLSLKRVVALKLLKPELVNSPLLLRRFNAEAEAVAKLSHPNTVGIYDFGQDADGTLFIAMEYVEGRSLRAALIAESPFAAPRALHIVAQIASSLSDAHASGIIHRDLKPDNIMLQDRGRSRDIVRVLDFGIAKLRDDARMTQQSLTQAGDVLGTPQYMAPEQIRGEEIDGRTDVYALGAILYETLTGRMVFEANSVVAMLSKHLLDVPEPPSRRRPDLGISAALDQLVTSCLSKDRRMRPPSMEQVGEQVLGLANSLGGLGRAGSSSDLLAHRPGSAMQSANAAAPTPAGARPGSVSGGASGAPSAMPPFPPPAVPSRAGPGPTPSGSAAPLAAAPGPGGAGSAATPGPLYAAAYSPAYSPVPLPQPAYSSPVAGPGLASRQGAALQRTSRLWMALIAIALLAIGGAGTYVLVARHSKAEPTAAAPVEASPTSEGSQVDPWNSPAVASPDPGATPGATPAAIPIRAPRLGNLGGSLFSAPGFFRLLVPPRFSTQPEMASTPDGKASRWTFSAADKASIVVLASPLPPELDVDDPEEAATDFGQTLGMQLTSWRWREVQGRKALAGSYQTTLQGIAISAEAVLYVKAKGFLVVLFACKTPDFEKYQPDRDSLFTQRISW